LSRIPIFYTVLGFVPIVGVIYFYAARKHPLAVVPPAATGAFVIPPELLPSDVISEQ
jgi:hypothetical protein